MNRSDVAEQSGEVFSRSMLPSVLARLVISHSSDYFRLFYSQTSIHGNFCSGRDVTYGEHEMDQHMVTRSLTTANGPLNWREALDVISLGSPEQVLSLLQSPSL